MPQQLDHVLTIGMATHKEFDSVWFTLEALHTYHPHVRYLVVDNSPQRCPRTEAICRWVGATYMHRPDLTGTSKPRDAVFQYAQTPWVMCIDSHVLLEPGAVQSAIDYCNDHPDSKDMVQGPLIYDDGRNYSTHWYQSEPPALWGVWHKDRRIEEGQPIEIPMTGLGMWMMRKAVWPGFNPLFRGFGGEEGYVHETVRRRGGKCLCHPALRWRHKFRDIAGVDKNPPPPYPLRLEDHVWNLLVGHRELGIGADPQIHHVYGQKLPSATWEKLVAEADAAQPFGGPRALAPQPTPQPAVQAQQPVVQVAGCGSCGKAPQAKPQPAARPQAGAKPADTLAAWVETASTVPSDFNEHVPTLRDLAAKCDSATEISAWQKPADAAMAAGLSEGREEKGRFTSVCRKAKPQWKKLMRFLRERFRGIEADGLAVELEPTDLLFIDTEHTAEALFPLLEKHHGKVNKHIALHYTHTYGHKGDQVDVSGNPKPGVLPAVGRFCAKHMEWGVVRHDANNHGLIVLSKLEDRKALPGLFKQAGNFLKAMTKHAVAGNPMVSQRVFELRMAECATCPERAFDRCAACGCPLAKKLTFATESCGLVKKGLEPKWGPVTDPQDLQWGSVAAPNDLQQNDLQQAGLQTAGSAAGE